MLKIAARCFSMGRTAQQARRVFVKWQRSERGNGYFGTLFGISGCLELFGEAFFSNLGKSSRGLVVMLSWLASILRCLLGERSGRVRNVKNRLYKQKKARGIFRLDRYCGFLCSWCNRE